MPDYDAEHFSPPAPTVVVVIQSLASHVVGNVRLQFDTGSDITILPRWAVDRLQVPDDAILKQEAVGFDGKASFVDAINLRVLIFDRSFRGRFLIVDGEFGVLGRDILNHLSIILDGPRQHWSIQPPSPPAQ